MPDTFNFGTILNEITLIRYTLIHIKHLSCGLTFSKGIIKSAICSSFPPCRNFSSSFFFFKTLLCNSRSSSLQKHVPMYATSVCYKTCNNMHMHINIANLSQASPISSFRQCLSITIRRASYFSSNAAMYIFSSSVSSNEPRMTAAMQSQCSSLRACLACNFTFSKSFSV